MSGGPDRAEARRRYDRMAAGYDCQLGLRSRRLARIVEGLRKRAVAALRLEPGQTVIDVGCGTGDSFPRLLAAVGRGGRVFGVDQSAGMLQVAAQRVADEGWANVVLIDRPSDLLADRLEDVSSEALALGALYVVAGRRPAAPRP